MSIPEDRLALAEAMRKAKGDYLQIDEHVRMPLSQDMWGMPKTQAALKHLAQTSQIFPPTLPSAEIPKPSAHPKIQNPRNRRIAELWAQGFTAKQIAREIGEISEKRVRNLITDLRKKHPEAFPYRTAVD